MSTIKNGGLDQYGAEPFEQQQFGTAGVEGLKATETHEVADNASRAVCNQSVHMRRRSDVENRTSIAGLIRRSIVEINSIPSGAF